jgi:hypothetical protein
MADGVMALDRSSIGVIPSEPNQSGTSMWLPCTCLQKVSQTRCLPRIVEGGSTLAHLKLLDAGVVE